MGHNERVANGGTHPTSPISRLDTSHHPYYTPPSPPPSVSPTDEKSFEAYTTSPKSNGPIFVETPAALLSEEQQHIIAYSDTAQPEADLPASTRPRRSGTLPALPSFTAPLKPPLELEHSVSADGAPYTQVIRASEDGPSTSTATVIPTKAQTVTLATPDTALLHPPPPVPRPTRRNTTGSAGSRPSRNILNAGHMSLQASGLGTSSQGFPSAGEEGDSGELDSDIMKEAEQIRAERRAKAQQEIEEAMTAPKRAKPGSVDQDGPLVGNLIGEDHVNYVLMYNMLTGIRVAVSRVRCLTSDGLLIWSASSRCRGVRPRSNGL